MKRLFFVLLGVALYVQAEAQPARRRVKPNDADKAEKTVDRASLQFPVAVEVPEDVVWRRDVYRQLDLTLDKNAPCSQNQSSRFLGFNADTGGHGA